MLVVGLDVSVVVVSRRLVDRHLIDALVQDFPPLIVTVGNVVVVDVNDFPRLIKKAVQQIDQPPLHP
jgi:hypothetical protein